MTQPANENHTNSHHITALMHENIKHLNPYITANVTDIHINRPYELFIKYTNGQRAFVKDNNLSHEWLFGMCKLMANISGQEFDEHHHPLLGFKLPGGHRVQAVSGCFTNSNFAMAIRVNNMTKFTLSDFGLSAEQQEIIVKTLESRKTILVSGGTGSGKTSFLNCLLPLIPINERIITIEDVAELIIPHKNHTSLLYNTNESSPVGPHDLFNTALRLDPDRIIVGEIRQKNAITFFNAINSGHDGSLATIHASSAPEALNKVCDYMILDGKISSSSSKTAITRLKNSISLIVQLTNNYGENRTASVDTTDKTIG